MERKPKHVKFEFDERSLVTTDEILSSGMDECGCACHHSEGMKHCIPCCQTCPHCRRRINLFFYTEHVEKCKQVNR